ncbi:MAG: 3-hydroxyacyl-CoA dehydrogenase family protein [Bacteroidota bacterium]|nr:3-hydroxyacyl-CoA dehydrogenase family protein [Bacteroidota bacterium]
MQIIVLADALQKEELSISSLPDAGVVWINDESEFLKYRDADAFVDLEFLNDARRKTLLAQLLPKPVIINSVMDTLAETHLSFIRINGWPTFLSSSLIEACCINEEVKQKAEDVFSFFNKKIEWLEDDAGFITTRVVSMIINEAFIALGEGVSTKEEINTAMKLGTAYPYGPFEWAEKIGVQNIVTLLNKLSKSQIRYMPSELLVQETNKAI